MTGQRVVEFLGGPVDGQQRAVPEPLPATFTLYAAPAPAWGPDMDPNAPVRPVELVYELRWRAAGREVDPADGMPVYVWRRPRLTGCGGGVGLRGA
ncbi:MAG: hypothetical protein IRZ05_18245 [Micromonosporaceae bacterium]|nr:hypothetical protein [Micromonosporaceae bacterium]